jgi:hypothetical protein
MLPHSGTRRDNIKLCGEGESIGSTGIDRQGENQGGRIDGVVQVKIINIFSDQSIE